MDFSKIWYHQDSNLSAPSQDGLRHYLDMGIGTGFYLDTQNFNRQEQDNTQTLLQMMGQATGESHIDFNEDLSSVHKHSLSESTSEMYSRPQNLQHQWQNKKNEEIHIQEYAGSIYSPSIAIPPTPSSIEMHGTRTHFLGLPDSQPPSTYEKLHAHLEDHEIEFSPLASPAVTPHDFRFSAPEYHVPGAYFSPLSSPALQAKDGNQSLYDLRHFWLTNSFDMNSESHATSTNSTISARKAKKKQLKPRNSYRTGPSPMLNPKSGKNSLSIASGFLDDQMESLYSSVTNFETDLPISTVNVDESEGSPVSPGSSSNMAPPCLPSLSPADISSDSDHPQLNALAKGVGLQFPATPASLMRIQSPEGNQDCNPNIKDSRINGLNLLSIENSNGSKLLQNSTEPTQQVLLNSGTIVNTKISEFQSLPSPPFPNLRDSLSASQSPQIDSLDDSTGNPRKARAVLRVSKKRANKQAHASPALLPRISPNIMPSIANGGKSLEDTASLFLASKSNYQNILEGTHLPGVYYSSELSTNLTSKRTSHKIAEQGRRNRMNSALHELARLLPRARDKDSAYKKSGNLDTEDGDGCTNPKGTSHNANSKASTVEQAIIYINFLKEQLENTNKDENKKLELVEQKLGFKSSFSEPCENSERFSP